MKQQVHALQAPSTSVARTNLSKIKDIYSRPNPTAAHRATLAVAGLVALTFGIMLLVAPQLMHASNGVALGTDASLLSEVRAPGGALLAFGILIAAGAWVRRLTYTAAIVSTALYVSYAAARAISIAVDGVPAQGLLIAAVVELVLGMASAFIVKAQEA